MKSIKNNDVAIMFKILSLVLAFMMGGAPAFAGTVFQAR